MVPQARDGTVILVFVAKRQRCRYDVAGGEDSTRATVKRKSAYNSGHRIDEATDSDVPQPS